MRRILIVGNWKMNKTASEAAAFVRDLIKALPASPSVDFGIAPPFTALESVRAALGASAFIQLGAQNMFWEDQGAYTGEISAPMLRDLGCRFVILGHSERRTLFGEQDDAIHKKIRAALKHGLQAILCIGESLAQRERGTTDEVLTGQLQGGLGGFRAEELTTLSIAYEPVWAIGTGRAATVDQAIAAHCTIRRFLSATWTADVADRARILYGGSVTPENVEGLLKSDQIDGALIGGACLRIDSFVKIAAVAQSIGVNR
ncbi:triose-phosphate isomerase [Nitrospira moscoviensis]|uniref:Triosephosphate isomerase n=1 Tax=Nitrospira moscoviensis TaxID=42253 RepID=A0A0K2G987_NITMO|nr:triose-phosphate isomerase [Nitrospira moscoviensis]ALA57414.1 Triosephosphate isomerase [Nitrospira moscoviensis]